MRGVFRRCWAIWFRRTTLAFLEDVTRQVLSNLYRDGSLYRPSTWASAWHTLFGPTGLVRHIWRPWWAYRRRDFHPNQQASNLSAQWVKPAEAGGARRSSALALQDIVAIDFIATCA